MIKKSLPILVLGILSFGCARDYQEVRGYTLINNMAHSPAYKAYSANEVTPDGKTMLPPVEGTIARGKMPHLYGQGLAETRRAAVELLDPFETTMETLARGEELYQDYCMACHGIDLRGEGPVVARGFPRPPNLVSGHALSFTKGRIYHVITVGQGNMAAHGPMMPPKDRWYLAQYIKEMQKK